MAGSDGEVSSFISVTLNAPVIQDRGKILLVVDQTFTAFLSAELLQLESDLAGDGWTVQRIDSAWHDAGTTTALRTVIQAAYNAAPTNVKAVYLFGHLPVYPPRDGTRRTATQTACTMRTVSLLALRQ